MIRDFSGSKEQPLPDIGPNLLRLAIDDLEAVSKDPRYTIDMFIIHCPLTKDGQTSCVVCLAGSVIAKSCRANPNTNVGWWDFPAETCLKLSWLDDCRHAYSEAGEKLVDHYGTIGHEAYVSQLRALEQKMRNGEVLNMPMKDNACLRRDYRWVEASGDFVQLKTREEAANG